MKLTVAMHSFAREARGKSRALMAAGRPQLMRRPLGGETAG